MNQPNQDEELKVIVEKLEQAILCLEAHDNVGEDRTFAYDKRQQLKSEAISSIKQWAIGMVGKDNSGLYDKAFIEHIQSHLKNGEEVICKICGKSAREICIENCKCKPDRMGQLPATPEGLCGKCGKPIPAEKKVINNSLCDTCKKGCKATFVKLNCSLYKPVCGCIRKKGE